MGLFSSSEPLADRITELIMPGYNAGAINANEYKSGLKLLEKSQKGILDFADSLQKDEEIILISPSAQRSFMGDTLMLTNQRVILLDKKGRYTKSINLRDITEHNNTVSPNAEQFNISIETVQSMPYLPFKLEQSPRGHKHFEFSLYFSFPTMETEQEFVNYLTSARENAA